MHIVGVYATRAAAQAAKLELTSQHDCAGYGDILVNGTEEWEQYEIDIVIRESPLNL